MPGIVLESSVSTSTLELLILLALLATLRSIVWQLDSIEFGASSIVNAYDVVTI